MAGGVVWAQAGAFFSDDVHQEFCGSCGIARCAAPHQAGANHPIQQHVIAAGGKPGE
jgi:hypothetical protein